MSVNFIKILSISVQHCRTFLEQQILQHRIHLIEQIILRNTTAIKMAQKFRVTVEDLCSVYKQLLKNKIKKMLPPKSMQNDNQCVKCSRESRFKKLIKDFTSGPNGVWEYILLIGSTMASYFEWNSFLRILKILQIIFQAYIQISELD